MRSSKTNEKLIDRSDNVLSGRYTGLFSNKPPLRHVSGRCTLHTTHPVGYGCKTNGSAGSLWLAGFGLQADQASQSPLAPGKRPAAAALQHQPYQSNLRLTGVSRGESERRGWDTLTPNERILCIAHPPIPHPFGFGNG